MGIISRTAILVTLLKTTHEPPSKGFKDFCVWPPGFKTYSGDSQAIEQASHVVYALPVLRLPVDPPSSAHPKFYTLHPN